MCGRLGPQGDDWVRRALTSSVSESVEGFITKWTFGRFWKLGGRAWLEEVGTQFAQLLGATVAAAAIQYKAHTGRAAHWWPAGMHRARRSMKAKRMGPTVVVAVVRVLLSERAAELSARMWRGARSGE